MIVCFTCITSGHQTWGLFNFTHGIEYIFNQEIYQAPALSYFLGNPTESISKNSNLNGIKHVIR